MKNKSLALLLYLILIPLSFYLLCVFFPQKQPTRSITISGNSSTFCGADYPIQVDRNFSGNPLAVGNKRFTHGYLTHALAQISFTLKGEAKYFKTYFGIDNGVGARGSARVIAYLDNKVIFVSKSLRGQDQPIPILLDLRAGKKLELLVDPVDNNQYDWAVWGDPEFTSFCPAGWTFSSPGPSDLLNQYQAPKTQPNHRWDTGQKNFDNKTGLLIWKIIAACFWLLFFVLLFMQRKHLFSLFPRLADFFTRPEGLVLGLVGVLAIWLFRSFWGEGLPASWDANGHYIRCLVMKDILLPHFKLDGWSPYWYLGNQQFLFYNPLLSIIIALVPLLSFNAFSLIFSFKLLYFLVFALLPFVCYWLLRQFELDPFPSALAALGALSFSGLHGIGIEGLFGPGLFTQSFGLILFCLCLGFIRRILNPSSSPKNTALLAILIGAIFMGHTITAFHLLMAIAFFMLFNITAKRFLLRCIGSTVLGLLLAALFLWPIIEFRNLVPPGVGWGPVDLLMEMLKGTYYSSPLINLFALLGILSAPFLRKKGSLAIFAIAIFTFFVSFNSIFTLPSPLNEIYLQMFRQRSLPYLGIYLIIFSGFFYQSALSFSQSIKVNNVRLRLRSYISTYSLLCIILLFAVLSGALIRLIPLQEQVHGEYYFSNYQSRNLREAFRWLKKNSPENCIIAYSSKIEQLGNMGFNHLDGHINAYADRYSIYGDGGRFATNFSPDHFADSSHSSIYASLVRYNISYLITWSKDDFVNLSLRPDLFSPVFANRGMVIWQTLGHDFRYLVNDNVNILHFSFSPETVSWEVENKANNNLITTAISWHPNWQLTINGIPSIINCTPDRLISFTLPEKEKSYQVILNFQKSKSEYVAYVISALTLTLLFWLLREERCTL